MVKELKSADQKKKGTKLSYEELENVANQIAAQAEALAKENQKLKMSLAEANYTFAFNHLNFRFKVLENSKFFNEEFIKRVTEDIVEALTPQEKENKNESEG